MSSQAGASINKRADHCWPEWFSNDRKQQLPVMARDLNIPEKTLFN
jgi:hypothetical protein